MSDNIEVEDAISTMASDATGIQSAVEELPPPTEASHESVAALRSYQIKPALQDKFKANPVKEIIRSVLSERLAGRTYDSTEVKRWTVNIANDVNTKVRELKMKRYKHIVQVIIGELKGAGIKCGVRCLWDSEADGYTSETFRNETIICVVVVFAVYLY